MDTHKPYTFTAEQLIKWADEQLQFADSVFLQKTPPEAYKQALNHLKYYVKNPIKEII